jgi:GNAT superfamily N-acetyltransferase
VERASIESLPPIVREITNTSWVPRTFGLRFEVWNAETSLLPQVREQEAITDEHDAHARHWAAFRGDEMIASARMCVHRNQEDTPDAPAFSEVCLPVPVATVNRLVVHPSARNRGLGSNLHQYRIEAAIKDGARCVVGTFPGGRIASLERLGFRLTGQQWTPNHAEALIVHAMVLML